MGLRVANIIEEGRLGGPQIRIVEVARQLNNMNIETTVILPKYESEKFKQKLNKYNIKTKSFPLHRFTKDKKLLLKCILFFLYEIFILYKYFKKEKFDLIHCSGGAWQYKGVVAGKLAGYKTLWHLNDTEMPSIVRLIFMFIASNFTDGLIVAGKRVKIFYIHQLGLRNKPVFEIQAPVDTTYFDPESADPDEIVNKPYGIKIVMVGNLNPKKGVEYFIYMADKLNKHFNHLHFFVVGKHFNSQKVYIEKLMNLKKKLNLKNLIFYGASNNVRNILKAANIYVCSSITEASPMSVWEAMSMEKAVVSTDVGDVSYFLENNVNGFIVPIKDPGSLAHKVKILINNYELRNSFGRKARETVRKYLDIKIVTKKHADVYKSIHSLS